MIPGLAHCWAVGDGRHEWNTAWKCLHCGLIRDHIYDDSTFTDVRIAIEEAVMTCR